MTSLIVIASYPGDEPESREGTGIWNPSRLRRPSALKHAGRRSLSLGFVAILGNVDGSRVRGLAVTLKRTGRLAPSNFSGRIAARRFLLPSRVQPAKQSRCGFTDTLKLSCFAAGLHGQHNNRSVLKCPTKVLKGQTKR